MKRWTCLPDPWTCPMLRWTCLAGLWTCPVLCCIAPALRCNAPEVWGKPPATRCNAAPLRCEAPARCCKAPALCGKSPPLLGRGNPVRGVRAMKVRVRVPSLAALSLLLPSLLSPRAVMPGARWTHNSTTAPRAAPRNIERPSTRRVVALGMLGAARQTTYSAVWSRYPASRQPSMPPSNMRTGLYRRRISSFVTARATVLPRLSP